MLMTTQEGIHTQDLYNGNKQIENLGEYVGKSKHKFREPMLVEYKRGEIIGEFSFRYIRCGRIIIDVKFFNVFNFFFNFNRLL